MCRVNKERFVFLYLLYGFANYAFPTPQCYSHSSWRVRWQTLLNRLSSHAAAAGRLPVCLWLLSWWHCRLPGKVEGHSCLFSFKFSVSPCDSRIFLVVENPQSIQWPTGLLCCTDCTPRWGVLGLAPSCCRAWARGFTILSYYSRDWTPESSRKHTAHAGFRPEVSVC